MKVKTITDKFVALCSGSRRISIRGISELSLGKNSILSSGEEFFKKSSGHSDEFWHSLIKLHDNGGNWNTSSDGLVLSEGGEKVVANIISKYEKPEPAKPKRKFAKKTKPECTKPPVVVDEDEACDAEHVGCSDDIS